jgi:hypothetical protein
MGAGQGQCANGRTLYTYAHLALLDERRTYARTYTDDVDATHLLLGDTSATSGGGPKFRVGGIANRIKQRKTVVL